MTIRKLAQLAGVSHATVSRALRDSPQISLAVRARIQALAKKHDYRPHPLVSELMAQLPHVKKIARTTLAVITSAPDWRIRPFPCEVYAGVESRARELGYRLEEFPLKDFGMSSERLSDVLYARGIEGLIIFPLERSMGHLTIKWSRFTSVAIGRTMARPHLHRVSFSHYDNALLALRHLHRLGYRRIGLAIPSWLRARVGDEYLAAYGLLDRNIRSSLRIPILVRPVFNAAEVEGWLRKYRADALLCNYDPLPEALRAEGLKIPEELGYATLDRFQATKDVTGIDQHPRQTGAAAVDALVAHLHLHNRGLPLFPAITSSLGTWVEGQTVRRHRASDTPGA